jgi:zinc D-Ala-D-Ala dipeptidase
MKSVKSICGIMGLLMMIVSLGCKDSNSSVNSIGPTSTNVSSTYEPIEMKDSIETPSVMSYDTAKWVDLTSLLNHAQFEIKYASEDNFTGKKIYDCPACYVRKELSAGIVSIEQQAYELGLGLLIYDCYRPSVYQQRLWDVKPDPRYVMPPSKGSNHSRGIAIDLTLFELESGELLDMGTDFDHLGAESHRDHPKLSEAAKANRELLLQLMRNNNFNSIRTEWWHFDYKNKNFPVESFTWNCD